MTLADFVSRLPGAKKAGAGYSARCPAHDDKRASLSIRQGDKGILLKCHAGCGVREILGKLGLKMADLYPKKPARAGGHNGENKIGALYDYKDERGRLLYQVVRLVPKDFRQRRPDASAIGGWRWNLTGVRRVLFRLPELSAVLKSDPDRPVFIAEGEKDVLALVAAGAVATCNPMGQGKWLADYTAQLAAAKVLVIIADKDTIGRTHARNVAAALARPGRYLKIIEVPGEKNKDAADYLAADGTVDELLRIAANATELIAAAPVNGKQIKIDDKAPALPECVFDLSRQRFFIPSAGEWIPVSDTRINVYFKSAGFSEFIKDNFGVTVLERAVQRIVMDRNVKYAGPLAGYWPGLAEVCGRKVLVTDGPKLVKPTKGDWPQLRAVLESILRAPSEEGDFTARQWDLLCGWLKSAYEALRDRTFRPGTALTLCGPHSGGKTQLAGILAEVLGGRSANPYAWMAGKTNFNAELLGCEVLIADDEASETDFKSRQQLGQRSKQICVGGTVRIEGKGATAGAWRPFWRLIILLNEEPQDLKVLPPMEEGVKDKFLMLRVASYGWPDDPKAFAALRTAISAELPAFVQYLLKDFKIPRELASARYGVRDWQHPDLLFDLEDLHPWRRLMELIDFVRPWAIARDGEFIGGANGEEWQGTVQDLYSILETQAGARADRVLTGLQSTGMFLKSAQRRLPQRIGDRKSGGHKIWLIRKPKTEQP